jgi:oligogalacturonide transporter
MSQERLSTTSKLLYGSGDVFAGGAFLLIALLFLNFLTDVVGMAPSLAGAVILVGRFWDAVSDPMMGWLSDRTSTRFGRRRPYFLLGIFPVFFTFAALWMPVAATSQWLLFAYFTGAYLLFNTVFTMVQVPYVALLPEFTRDYAERISVAGIRLVFSSFSAVVAGTVPKIIVDAVAATDAGTTRWGYGVMGLVFGVVYALPWVFVFLGTRESAQDQPRTPRMGNPFREFASVIRNRSFRHHAGMFIGSQTAVDFLSALFAFYMKSVLGRFDMFSPVMGSLLVVPIFSIPIFMRVARRKGKTVPMHYGLVIWIVALLFSLAITESNWYLVFGMAFLSGIGTSSSVFVPWSILPEVTDVDELISGRRREGVYGGVATFLRKLAGGIALFVLGVLLDVIGYAPDADTQTAGAVLGIRLLMALVPTACILVALVFSHRYAVTGAKHAIMMAEVDRLREGGAKGEVDAETRAVCEELSGIPYERLWSER